jgi:hypothetical protein
VRRADLPTTDEKVVNVDKLSHVAKQIPDDVVYDVNRRYHYRDGDYWCLVDPKMEKQEDKEKESMEQQSSSWMWRTADSGEEDSESSSDESDE